MAQPNNSLRIDVRPPTTHGKSQLMLVFECCCLNHAVRAPPPIPSRPQALGLSTTSRLTPPAWPRRP
jgi:hypothetical protein